MNTRNTRDTISDYLEDAIALEKTFEKQLRGFAKQADSVELRQVFERHADETPQAV